MWGWYGVSGVEVVDGGGAGAGGCAGGWGWSDDGSQLRRKARMNDIEMAVESLLRNGVNTPEWQELCSVSHAAFCGVQRIVLSFEHRKHLVTQVDK